MKSKQNTYELGVCVDPAESHEAFGDLAFEEFNFVVHAALVLLSGLSWHD